MVLSSKKEPLAFYTPSGASRIASTVSPTAQAGAKGGRMISASAAASRLIIPESCFA
jgi:hypothetical protein